MITARVTVQSNRLAQMAAGLAGKKRQVLRAKAERVAGRARQLVPVRTGALRASIGVREQGDEAIVEATAEYAPFVEYGTSRQGAKPYLTPAAEEERSSFLRELGDLFK